MLYLLGIVLILMSPPASAGQRQNVQQAGEATHLDFSWQDATGRKRRVDFTLPTRAVELDATYDITLPVERVSRHAAREVLAWSRSQPDLELTAIADGHRVVVRAEGEGATEPVLAESRKVRRRAIAEWLADNGYRRGANGITFDHAPLVVEYADDVEPLARQIAAMTQGPREFAELALSFVQSIPYDEEAGFHRPLALLARNKGDCDSKVVLYLALIRSAYPELPVSVVYVPGHALAGVGLPAQGDEWSFRHGGQSYVYAEPVGPQLVALGVRGRSASIAGATADVVPVDARRVASLDER